MKIPPMGAELFHTDGRTDGHDETKYSLAGIFATRLKLLLIRRVTHSEEISNCHKILVERNVSSVLSTGSIRTHSIVRNTQQHNVSKMGTFRNILLFCCGCVEME